MSTFRPSFFRKRRSDDESSESDSDEEGPPVKKIRQCNGEANIKDSLATRFRSLLQWVTDLPVSSYFKDSMLRNSSLLKQPLEAVILDQMDEENQDDPDIIEIEDEDTHPATSSISRQGRVRRDFPFPKKPCASSTPFDREMRSLREAASNHLYKPVNGFHKQPAWTGKERCLRKTRSQQRNAPLSNPGTDVEILLDTRDIPADESDELKIVTEVTKSKQPNTRSCRTISPVYKSGSNTRGVGVFSHKTMVNGKTSSMPYLRKEKQPVSNRYTAHEVVRLQEKEQYQLLLNKMVNGPMYHPAVKTNSKPVEIQVDLTNDEEPVIAAPIKKEVLQQPVKDFLKKYYKPCQLVSPISPPSMDELDKIDDAIASNDDDIKIIKEINLPEYKPKSKKKTDFFSSEWIRELKMTINAETESRLQIVKQEEDKIERFKKRRDAKLAEETHLRDQLKLSGAISNIWLEEETEFPDLTIEMEMVIDAALDLCLQPSDKLSELPEEKVQVLRSDLQTLSGLNWLNDEIINFYLALIALRSKQNDSLYPKVYSYNSFFYSTLKSRGESRVLRWTKNVDVFAYDILIYPLHLGMHWALCIIDNRSKQIKYYDSMGSSEEQCLKYIQNYIVAEMRDKKKMEIDQNYYSTEVVKDIPQQMNGSDCGMFTLKYAEYISRDAPITFTQENMQYFRRKMVYEIITRQLL